MNCTIVTVSQPNMTKLVELELTGCAVGHAPCRLPSLAFLQEILDARKVSALRQASNNQI
jgi:hypothetical protein